MRARLASGLASGLAWLLGLVSGILLRRRAGAVGGAVVFYAVRLLAYHLGATHWQVIAGISVASIYPVDRGVCVVNWYALLSLLLICYAAPAYRRR